VVRGGDARALRLGVVPYLNVEPIVHGLQADPRFEVVRDAPSRVADLLHAGAIDLGMIPSVEYARGDYAIVPGIAIASRGAVGSVELLHSKPIGELRRVALDASSRTSIALLRILLREQLGRDPEYVEMPPDPEAMLEAADAALLIGDNALYYAGSCPRLDLGEAWQALTGLSFVFAFWAGRPGCVGPDDLRRLQGALRAGRARLGEIAASYNGNGAGHAAQNEMYLRESIVFDLGDAEQAGLREFYRRAYGLGLIPRCPELRFHENA
jgi:chorismate dehydratase